MIPLSTTTISVLRVAEADLYAEPYAGSDEAARTTVASGIRAVIDRPGGNLQQEGGQQNVADYGLVADPIPELKYLDLIKEDTTGRTFKIVWFIDYFDHVEALMRDVEGEV